MRERVKQTYSFASKFIELGLCLAQHRAQILLPIICFIFLLNVCSPPGAQADDFYASCVKSYQFTDDAIDIFSMTPVNDICQQRCLTECSAFSREASLPQDPSLEDSNSGMISEKIELNQDIIDECMTQCKNGVIFSSTFRVSNAHSYEQCKKETSLQCLNIQNSGPLSIGAACFDSGVEGCENATDKKLSPCQEKKCGPVGYKKGWAKDNSYQTSIYVEANKETKIIIDMLNAMGEQGGNKIYLCGHKKVKLTPIFPNINASDYDILKSNWNSTTMPPTAWSSKKEHVCFMTDEDVCSSTTTPSLDYASSSNKNLWSIIQSEQCGWNAKNPCYTDTKTYPMDGDELMITWRGNYALDAKGGNDYLDRYLAIDCLTNTDSSALKSEECRKRWNEATKLALKIDNKKITLEGEGIRTTGLIPDYSGGLNTKDSANVPGPYGLTARLKPENVSYRCNADEKGCDCDNPNGGNLEDPKCIIFLNKGIGAYSYSGVLNNFSSKRGQLRLKHPYPKDIYCPLDLDNDTAALMKIIDFTIDTVNKMRASCMPSKYGSFEAKLMDVMSNKVAYLTRYGCTPSWLILMLNVDNSETFKEKYEVIQNWQNSLGRQTAAEVDKFIASADNLKRSITNARPEYQNSVGGFEVEIDWKGCPFRRGERLQYTIAPAKSNFTIDGINESSWQDLPAKIFEPNSPDKPTDEDPNNVLTVTSKIAGYLFFRIKALEPPSTISAELKELYTNPGHWSGQYHLAIQQLGASNVLLSNGVIRELLGSVIQTLFGFSHEEGKASIGEVKERGVLYAMYNGIVQNKLFINLIRAFLVLYITFLGVGFLLGIVKIEQRELLVRLIKVAFIITIVSPNSWKFFGGYIVPLFVGGAIELTEMFVGISAFGDNVTSYEELKKDPLALFSLFDGPLKMMLATATWKKMVGLLFSGVAGIILVIAIIVGIVMYMITIVKVVLMFMLALIMLSLLLILAPIFIPMMLFKLTAQLFRQWVLGLFSFTLQPVFVFAAIGLFNIVIVTLFQLTLAFTVCETCYLDIDLGFYKACWIPGYITLVTEHMPAAVNDSFLVPPGIISNALTFLILTNGAMILCSLLPRIVDNIVTGVIMRESNVAMAAQTGADIARSKATAAFSTASSATSGAVRNLIQVMQKSDNGSETDKSKADNTKNETRRGGTSAKAGGGTSAKAAAVDKASTPPASGPS